MANSSSVLTAVFTILLLLFAACEESPTGSGGSETDHGDQEEPSTISVDGVDPEEGSPGTSVNITGDGFPNNPEDITVTFAGTEAEVTEASEDELTVSVPDGAESGTIRVTVGGEQATGPDFTVTEPVEEVYTVSGRVVDNKTDMGLEGIEIRISGGTDPVQTDSNGEWSIDGIQGPATVSAHSDQWEFPVHTRLVLGAARQVNFEAYSSYDPPSGTRVAYQFREGCSGGLSCSKPFDIWTMDSNGLNKEQLTDSEGSDHSPTWSPDGSQIAFDSDRGGDGNSRTIWIMDSDGDNLTDTGVEGVSPSWSPDGERIAYTNGGALYVMELDGGTSKLFQTSGQFVYAPAWSPGGSHITFALNEGSSNTHIWVIEADGDNPTRLTEGDGTNNSPAWHPAGEGILYSVGSPASSARLRIMDLDGSNHRTRDWPDHSQTEPQWSPGGDEILYVYRNMIPIGNRIHWNPADGDAWMRIAPDTEAESEYWANSPAWAPQ